MKKTIPPTRELGDGLSKNKGKTVKYRIRKQQEVEAEKEIHDFKKQESDKPK